MVLFIFTRQFLERARSEGISPDIEGDPGYFGFHQNDVARYGYDLFFMRNLPGYAEKIWDLDISDDLHLMPENKIARKPRSWPQKLAKKVKMKRHLLEHQGLRVMKAYRMNGSMSKNIHLVCATLDS
jgi:hypothetical protein